MQVFFLGRGHVTGIERHSQQKKVTFGKTPRGTYGEWHSLAQLESTRLPGKASGPSVELKFVKGKEMVVGDDSGAD